MPSEIEIDTMDEMFPFVCGICSLQFNKLTEFYIHFQVHGIEIVSHKYFHVCMERLDKVESLNKGSRVKTLFSCGICHLPFPSLCLLHDHLACFEKASKYTIDIRTNEVENIILHESNTSILSNFRNNPKHTITELTCSTDRTQSCDIETRNFCLTVGSSESKTLSPDISQKNSENKIDSFSSIEKCEVYNTINKHRLTLETIKESKQYKKEGIFSISDIGKNVDSVSSLSANNLQSLSRSRELNPLAYYNKVLSVDENHRHVETYCSQPEKWTDTTSGNYSENMIHSDSCKQCVNESVDLERKINNTEHDIEESSDFRMGVPYYNRSSESKKIYSCNKETNIEGNTIVTINDTIERSSCNSNEYHTNDNEGEHNTDGFRKEDKVESNTGCFRKEHKVESNAAGFGKEGVEYKTSGFEKEDVDVSITGDFGKEDAVESNTGDFGKEEQAGIEKEYSRSDEIEKNGRNINNVSETNDDDSEDCISDECDEDITANKRVMTDQKREKRRLMMIEYQRRYRERKKLKAQGKCDTDSQDTNSFRIASMKTVKESVVPSSQIKVPCDICGLLFKKKNLKRHTETHTEAKPHQCEICYKTFKTKNYLYSHKMHHRKVKDLMCDYCGKAFNNGPNLRQHLKIHVGERTLQCPVCPKKFRSNYILKDHIQRHSNDKPHMCRVCGRRFKVAQEVLRHISVHSDERPYVCKVCNKGFKHRSNLIKHNRIHLK